MGLHITHNRIFVKMGTWSYIQPNRVAEPKGQLSKIQNVSKTGSSESDITCSTLKLNIRSEIRFKSPGLETAPLDMNYPCSFATVTTPRRPV